MESIFDEHARKNKVVDSPASPDGSITSPPLSPSIFDKSQPNRPPPGSLSQHSDQQLASQTPSVFAHSITQGPAPDTITITGPTDTVSMPLNSHPVIVMALSLITVNAYWLFWLSRTYRRIRVINSQATKITPGKALGYLFIIIFNAFWFIRIAYDLPRAIGRIAANKKKGVQIPSVAATAMFLLGTLWIVGSGIDGRPINAPFVVGFEALFLGATGYCQSLLNQCAAVSRGGIQKRQRPVKFLYGAAIVWLFCAVALFWQVAHMFDKVMPQREFMRSVNAESAQLVANPYDLMALDVQVRAAVNQAREFDALAEVVYRRAQQASNSAREIRGTTLNDSDGSTYVGEVGGESGREYPSGLGVSTETSATVYSGEFVNGAADGYGVITSRSSVGERRWAGQISQGHASGAGQVHLAVDGSIFSGTTGDGFGVITFGSNGLKYEGQTMDGSPQGYGVIWDSSGAVSEQGVWKKEKLTTALGAPSK